jgi:hypothetical protein
MLSEAYQGEATKKSSVFEWHKWFKESSHAEITYEDKAHHFLQCNGTVHFEFIPQGQKVNQAYYVEKVKQLCEDVHRKRPEHCSNDWILHHDSAPTHKALSVKKFLSKNPLLQWNSHPISLIRLWMTSGCFQK